ncbi:MAG: LEA type 2 family protein [Rhodospirillales bacterium]
MTFPTTTRRRFSLMSLGLVMAVLAGCSSLIGPDVKPPEVTVESAGLTRPGIVTQEVTLGLDLQNREHRDLAVDSISFDVDVNGQRMGSGVLLKSFVLPADGSVRIDVPVKVATSDLLTAMGRLGSEKTIAYTLDGQLRLAGGDKGEVPFTEKGELALPLGLPLRAGS